MILTAAARLRLLDVPLERDEGEYAYAGQLLLRGVPPYSLVYSMKLPGIYAAYALLLATFGESISGVHAGLLLVNLATTLAVFLLGRHLIDATTGIVAAASYAVLSIGPAVQGFAANAEQFVLLPAVTGLLLVVRAADSGGRAPLFAGGLLLGAAVLVKQHAAAFLVFAGLYLVYRTTRQRLIVWRRVAATATLLVAGPALLGVATGIALWAAGVLEKSWLWTVVYPRSYVSQMPLAEAPRILGTEGGRVLASAPSLYALAGLGLVSVVRDRTLRPRRAFLLGLCAFSFLAVCPGFYFRPHYFVLLMPAAALLAGVGTRATARFAARARAPWVRWGAPAAVALLALAAAVHGERAYLLRLTPTEIARAAYGPNPFPESIAIADRIRQNTAPDARIAVVGSEPQIYFYSRRRSVTGYVYTYPLMESHPLALHMQREMIREIEAGRPSYLVYVEMPTSWLFRPESHDLIFRWLDEYTEAHYTLDGLVETGLDGGTKYIWGEAARGAVPRSWTRVWLYRRSD